MNGNTENYDTSHLALFPATWRRITGALSAKLGCEEVALREPGVMLTAHGKAFSGFRGVYIWAMLGPDGDPRASVVSTPPELMEEVRAALPLAETRGSLDHIFWLEALGDRVDRVVGPSYQGYVDAGAFTPPGASPARMLMADERVALARLASACPAEEWAHSAIQPHHDPIFVISGSDGALEAAASLTRDGERVVAVGVITRADARGRGHGRSVVGALTAWALSQGETVHYQTLRANTASVAIARSLGFQEIAGALAIRLR